MSIFTTALRRRRERKREQALAVMAGHFTAQLENSADWVITVARRQLVDDLGTRRQVVTVEDVQAWAWENFGLVAVPPQAAAAALRARYEVRSGALDLDTDAYDSQWRETT